MIQKKWVIRNTDPVKVKNLKDQLGQTSDVLCSLLVSRGLDNYEKVKQFFNPSLSRLHNPWLMKDMDKAVGRVMKAIQNHEKILIYGDYDVDGTTATAMLLRFLKVCYPGQNTDFYIPDRYLEGYGLSYQGIEYAKEKNVTLIIALDCGITGNDVIHESKDSIDFIICDHHLPGSELPEAIAILNPKQKNCPYPFKELCGCGVTFKFITALSEKMGLDEKVSHSYLDLVALATGADVVPILDENRILVHFGLQLLNEKPCEGIKALKETNDKIKIYTLINVIFGLAPKINAAGRMHHARLAVELFIEDDTEEAKSLARQLYELNDRRKHEDETITKEALSILANEEITLPKKSSVVFREEWHQGVIGIVASRLIENYYRPTIVLTKGKEFVSGSARSIRGFNIYNAIHACKEYLVKFGGHNAAAGLTLLPENLEIFSEKFEEVVSQTLPEEFAIPQITIDTKISLDDIQNRLYKTLLRMEPFGQQNPEPVFITKNLKLNEYSRVVGENHVRFVFVTKDKKYISGIGFNLKEQFSELSEGANIDIVYTIHENEWKDQKTLQLKIIDFKPSIG